VEIDGLPWRVYLWVCAQAVIVGALCGVVGARTVEWVVASLVGR